MHGKILMASTITASLLALGLCDTIKSKIPFLGGGDDKEASVAQPAGDEGGDEATAGGEKTEPAENEAEAGGDEATAGGEKAEPEPEGDEKPEPAAAPKAEKGAPPDLSKDVPKSIKTAAEIDTVLVLAHPGDRKKYMVSAKKLNKDIKQCHKQILVDDPKALGKIKFRITVSAEGVATDVQVEKNTTGSDALAECTTALFKAHDWPKRKDGQERVLAIPIMFVLPDKGAELLI